MSMHRAPFLPNEKNTQGGRRRRPPASGRTATSFHAFYRQEPTIKQTIRGYKLSEPNRRVVRRDQSPGRAQSDSLERTYDRILLVHSDASCGASVSERPRTRARTGDIAATDDDACGDAGSIETFVSAVGGLGWRQGRPERRINS
jgi:hypothetical protein